VTAAAPSHVHLVDDDAILVSSLAEGLRALGHRVTTGPTGAPGLALLHELRPDLLVVDLMMPGMDGATFVRHARADAALAGLRIVVLSAKVYDTDRRAALAAGADAFALKPARLPALAALFQSLLHPEVDVGFWGVRGTLPVNGPATLRYGGDTSCVCLRFPEGQTIVLDAGSGVRPLGQHLARQGRLDCTLLFTHPHWDHLNALPFFAPLFVPGNHVEIAGPPQGPHDVRALVAAQMDGVFFPITPREFAADVHYRDLAPGPFTVQGVAADAFTLMHPGTCFGYRFTHRGRSLAYVTDNELFDPGLPGWAADYEGALADWLRGVDLLITDTTWSTADEYRPRVGWGHSTVAQVARLCVAAGVRRLALFHHDPSQSDDDIDRKHDLARDAVARLGGATEVLCPAQGASLRV